jgi:ubiquitin carboxyl-terminal hydrolase 14
MSESNVTVTVKWGKQVYENIALSKNSSVSVFKAQLYALTLVPIVRQKIMSKAWKGMLKDDADLKEFDKLVDGTTIMLMGSAEVVEKPKEATVFIEDMATKDVAAAGVVYPAGLTNLGNTCYMNATLQCLRPISELMESLKNYNGGISSDLRNNFASSLRDLYCQLESSFDSVTPSLFVSVSWIFSCHAHEVLIQFLNPGLKKSLPSICAAVSKGRIYATGFLNMYL